MSQDDPPSHPTITGYSWLVSALWQAAQLANSVAHSHLVFSTPSAIRSCIQFGAAGALH